ncbi:calcium-binding protein [Phaeovulum sp.]|uniref:calcium-binding protein n=1 Tax=Phaeovulum sp. TaxID=2934796 RepID=UPI0035616A73
MMLMTGVLGLLLIGFSADVFSFFGTTEETEDEQDELLPAEVSEGDSELDPKLYAPEVAAAPVEGEDAGDDILWGGEAGDSIDGLGGDDQLNGYGGNDTLSGGAGSDDMHGGTGDDQLSGGAGNDALSGNDGQDTLAGEAGDDTLSGGMGDDILWGGEGADLMLGGSGNDMLAGGAGDDSLQGCDGDDILSGGLGSDELFGDAGNDTLIGRVADPETGRGDIDTGQDLLNGGRGDDVLVLGSNDFGNGGEGADLFAAGDWIDPAHPATILFEPEQDQIVLVYDPGAHPDPQISLEPSTSAPDSIWIKLDGVALVEVLHGAGLNVADIALQSALDLPAVTAR